MRIGEVAQRAGVRTSLIRYYESIGLLEAPERVSGQRRYDETVLRRLTLIDVAQRAGMSLDEIRLLLAHGNDEFSTQLAGLARRKLLEIDALIERARRVRTWMEQAAECRCETIDTCTLFTPGARPASSAPSGR